MKIIIFLLSVILIFLIGSQNLGSRYGSYGVWSWLWLILSLSFVISKVYKKEEFSNKHLILLSFLVLVILIQPLVNIHPILILATSLIFIIPFLIFEFRKNRYLSHSRTQLSEEFKYKCRSLIAENKLEICFEILSNEVEDEKLQKSIIFLEQKWNQNKRERNMNLNTNEWLEIQAAKIVNELLDILK